jgi:hypothetical protein
MAFGTGAACQVWATLARACVQTELDSLAALTGLSSGFLILIDSQLRVFQDLQAVACPIGRHSWLSLMLLR